MLEVGIMPDLYINAGKEIMKEVFTSHNLFDRMKALHNGENNIKGSSFKVEQRIPLCSNKGVNRCSTLDFNPNDPLVSEDMAIEYLSRILVEIFLHQQK